MVITLIGMPGVGKSTLGTQLADALALPFIDTDTLIVAQEGRSLQAILDEDGVEAFLAIEAEILCGLSVTDGVVSTGGSAIYSELAMTHLQTLGKIMYLYSDFKAIESRLSNLSTRGVVIRPGMSLKDTYDERLPLYAHYADAVISCSNRPETDCVADMIQWVLTNEWLQ